MSLSPNFTILLPSNAELRTPETRVTSPATARPSHKSDTKPTYKSNRLHLPRIRCGCLFTPGLLPHHKMAKAVKAARDENVHPKMRTCNACTRAAKKQEMRKKRAQLEAAQGRKKQAERKKFSEEAERVFQVSKIAAKIRACKSI